MGNRLVFSTAIDSSGYARGIRDMEILSGAAGKRMTGALSGTTAGYSVGAGSLSGHGGRGGVIGETVVLLREMGRGNYARVPGSLTILMQRMGMLKLFVTDNVAAAAKMALTWEIALARATSLARSTMETAIATRAAFEAGGPEVLVTLAQVEADEAAAGAAELNRRAIIQKTIASKEAEGAAKTSISTLGIVAVVLVAVAVAAYYVWKHFRTLGEQMDRTAAVAAKGYGDMSKAMELATKKSAEATADLVNWNKKLADSQESLADKTNAVITALTEEYNLKKKLAQEQGASQMVVDAMEQEERQKKLDALNQSIAAGNEQLARDKKAAAEASGAAFTGPEALARNARIEDIPEQRRDAEEKVKDYKNFVKELQDKVEKENLDAENAIRLSNREAIFGKSPEELAAAIAAAKEANAEKGFAVGPKGQEQQMSLNQATAALTKNQDFIDTLKKDLPRLVEVQRELAAAVKEAEETGNKDSSSVMSLAKERDKLISDMALHQKYDPEIEAAKKMAGAGGMGGSDSLVRVGNFLGSSRGQIDTLQQEANRIARGHWETSKRIEQNTRPRTKPPGENHYSTH
jgi:hypothetical protein